MLTRSGHPSGQGVVVTRVRGPSSGWPFLLEAALTVTQGRHRAPRPRRHSTRGAATERPYVNSSALRRPLVTTTAAIAVIGASAAGFATTQGQAAPASFTVSSEAVAQSADLHRTSLEDRAYLAKSKNAGSQRAAALAEHTRLAAIAQGREGPQGRGCRPRRQDRASPAGRRRQGGPGRPAGCRAP